MRKVKYLSPTSISLFYNNRDEFYLTYLADNRPPKISQTKPMSIGSAFDAYVKSYLVEKLFGANVKPEFDLKTLFENQVDANNRSWAWENGKYVFECYKRSGALGDLMIELNKASSEPKFETRLEGIIQGINLLGKPDLYFISSDGLRVIIDWKVNGYCGKKSGVSPKKGYIRIRDGWDHSEIKASRSHGTSHKDAQVIKVKGFDLNAADYMEDLDEDWSKQLSIYAWLSGVKLGEDFIAGIDQIVAKPYDPKPLLRVASLRSRISVSFQNEWYTKIQIAWEAIQDGHIFNEISREASDDRCKTLDQYYIAYEGDDPDTKWLTDVTRQHMNHKF